jgi:putative sigma-54 modulation protein
MTISIRLRDIDGTEELRQEVERSLAFATDRFEAQVEHVSIYLADLNGPKGGSDKLCQITAKLRSGDRVQILNKGSEILSGIRRATRRLGHQIGRSIQRWKRLDPRRFRESVRIA